MPMDIYVAANFLCFLQVLYLTSVFSPDIYTKAYRADTPSSGKCGTLFPAYTHGIPSFEDVAQRAHCIVQSRR